MKSMTGYGSREESVGKYTIYLEMKSYNNRYLDIQVGVPSQYGPLEPKIRAMVSEHVERGRVEVSCRVRETEEDVQILVDAANARAYAGALRELAAAAGVDPEVHLGHLIRMEGILKFERNRDVEGLQQVLMPILQEVMDSFDESRVVEGRRTEAYIRKEMAGIFTEFETISSNSDRLEALLRENLKSRFAEMAHTIDESRIAAETAVLLVKYSIGEEIDRFRGHADTFLEILDESNGQGVSKKLDFICQEMNREINTIASKSFLLEVNQVVVNIKDGIEKIREQLRNVE